MLIPSTYDVKDDEKALKHLLGSQLGLLWDHLRAYLEKEIRRLFPQWYFGTSIYVTKELYNGGFYKISLDIGFEFMYVVGMSVELGATKRRICAGKTEKCRNCFCIHPGFQYLRTLEDILEFTSVSLPCHAKLYGRISKEVSLKQSNNRKKKKKR